MECNCNKIKQCFIATICLIGCIADISFSQQISLNNLAAFDAPSSSWQIVGNVFANPLTEQFSVTGKGMGILVGSASTSKETPSLTTKMNHGDLSIKFDVLLTTGASASIWLQGRYGLHLADNWNTRRQNHIKNGALFPPAAKGIEALGYTPRQNVARAPGLWQHVKIVFQAPRFDEQGKKTRDAKFVLVRQNGLTIQENKTLPHPSKGALSEKEVSSGPIEFKVHNETVAFRNIEYTASSGEKVKVKDLSYKLYVDKFLDEDFFYGNGKEGPIRLPDLDSREPTTESSIDVIHTQMTNEVGQDFSLVFEGRFNIPESGKYHFEAVPNGIGAFVVDGDERLRWDIFHKKGSKKVELELSEGIHPFKLTVVNFGEPKAGIFVNGPGIINQPLHQPPKLSDAPSVRPIILQPGGEPLIQRSFIFYENQKLLNCINVGYPEGIHYSLNLSTGGLLQVWKGEFGDVTSMWHDRGLQQVLKPLGSVLTISPSQQVSLSDKKDNSSQMDLDYGEFRLEGYDLNQKGEPVFHYILGKVGIRDHVTLGSMGRTLTRSLRFVRQGEVSKSLAWYRVAKASKIEQVDDRLYSIDDKSYFLEIREGTKPEIKQEGNSQSLFVLINIGTKVETLSYSLIW